MKAPLVVVTENIGAPGIRRLKELGMEVRHAEHLSADQLRPLVAQADAVVVRGNTSVNKRFIDDAARLQVIGRAGCGLDNLDVKYADAKGITVLNTPNANADSTAEHAIALMMASLKRIPQGDRAIRSDSWDREAHTGTTFAGKTFGVVGTGQIGTKAATIAKAIGMKTLGTTRGEPRHDATGPISEFASIEDVFRRADVVSLHVPLTDANRKLVGRRLLQEMKPTAHLINCARGGVIDGEALLEALDRKRLAGAALDVHEVEPPFDGGTAEALAKHPRTIATQHQGGQTEEAMENMGTDVAEQFAKFFSGQRVDWAVGTHDRQLPDGSLRATPL